MATLELADISDALSLVFRDPIQNQINRQVVLLNLLPVKMGNGKVSNWTAKFTGRTNAAGYAEGADMGAADFDQEIRDDATLSWSQYRKGAKVSGLAQATQATNMNPFSTAEVGGADIFEDEIHDAVHRLALGIGTNLYNGTGGAGDPLIGLETAVDSAGVYATIDPAVRTEWSATEQTFALAALSFSNLRAFHTAVYEACGEPPEFCIMPPVIFDAVGDLFGSERRWIDEINTVGRGLVKLRGGFKALEIDGIPYVRDRFATANTIFGLNTQWMRISEIPGFNSPMSYERFVAIMLQITGDRPPQEAYGEMMARNNGIKPYVDILARTGDAQKAQIKWYGQLESRRRNGHGKITLT